MSFILKNLSESPELTNSLIPIIKEMGNIDSEENLKKRLLKFSNSKNNYITIIVFDNHPIGYGWVESYSEHLRSGSVTARLHDLYVKPKYRKKGIGRMLFQSIRKWCSENNVRYLQWQSGKNSQGFYESLGFKGDTESDLKEHPFHEIDFGSEASG
jgi:GNAT superfamily N-acetyltransferase